MTPGDLLRALRAGDRPWTLGLGLLGGLLCLPLLRWHFTWDQGVYGVIADTLLRGGVAYRDAWEFRPPGVFCVYSAAFALFGRAESSVRTLELLSIALSCSALVRIGTARLGSTTAGAVAAALLPVLYLPLGHWHTAQCESFQLPFLLWALALWPGPEDDARPGARCFAAGILAASAVLIKTPGILFAVLFVVDRLWTDRRRPGLMGKLRLAAITCAGLAAPPLLMFAYYGLRGALPELVHALFVYAPGYASRAAAGMSPLDHAIRIPEIVDPALPAALLGLLALGRGWRSPRAGDLLRGIVLTSTAFAIVVVQGRYYRYHTILALPFLALAAGFVIDGPGARLAGRGRGIAAAGLGLVLWIAGVHAPSMLGRWTDLFQAAPVDVECARLGFSYEESRSLAEAIRARTSASERIFLWTNTPLALFLSGRPMAGPYSHLGMMIPYEEEPGRLAALLDRLAAERPGLIVTGGRGPFFQDLTADQLLDRHGEVRAFVERNYRADGGLGPYRFWRRKDPVP